jgi:hypothetical protein
MKTNPDIAAQTARFNEAVSQFVPVSRGRFTRLHPFREGISVLREKGASYRLIREMLAGSGVSVALDTLGAFIREVIEQRAPSTTNTSRRVVRRTSGPTGHNQSANNAPMTDTKQMPFTVAPPIVHASDNEANKPPQAAPRK